MYVLLILVRKYLPLEHTSIFIIFQEKVIDIFRQIALSFLFLYAKSWRHTMCCVRVVGVVAFTITVEAAESSAVIIAR